VESAQLFGRQCTLVNVEDDSQVELLPQVHALRHVLGMLWRARLEALLYRRQHEVGVALKFAAHLVPDEEEPAVAHIQSTA